MASNSQKRPGTASNGELYEQLMIANTVFTAINDDSITNFTLFSNDVRFGKFDDIVVETFGENEKKYAVQLKHVENEKALTISALTADSGGLSLCEYFQSSKKIPNTHKLVLFTNRNLTANDGQQVLFERQGFTVRMKKIDTDPLLKTGTSGKCYKFEDMEIKEQKLSSLELQAYEEFFAKFYLYTNQANVRRVENTLRNSFQNKFDCEEDDFKIYLDFIRKWYYDRNRENFLDKKMMKRVVALTVLPFIQAIHSGPVNDKLKILQEAINNFAVTIFQKEGHVTTHDASRIGQFVLLEDTLSAKVAKIWGDGRDGMENRLVEMNKIIKKYSLGVDYVTDVNKLSDIELSKILWLMDICPLIVKEDKTTSAIINFCREEKFVLIGRTEEHIKERSVFRDLSDMDCKSDLYEDIINFFECSIQGKHEVSLQTLISINEDFRKIFTPNVLVEMVEEPYQIGGKKEALPVPYINRFLTRSIISYDYLNNIDRNTLVVIDNFKYVQHSSMFRGFTLIRGEEYFAKVRNNEKNLESSISVEKLDQNNDSFDSNFDNPLYCFEGKCSNKQFEQINEVNSVNQCHHLRITRKGSLEWIQSYKYDIADLEEFCEEDSDSVSETAWYDEAQNPLNLVIGDPGMGKSVLMQNFKNTADSTFWTVFFYNEDIVSLIKFFQKRVIDKQNFEQFVLTYRYPQLKLFDKEFLKLLLREKRLLYVWDALDEISSENLDHTAEIISSLSDENIRQWVTCRSHLKEILQKKLGVFSKTLIAMTEEEQNLYIRERLSEQNSKDIDAKIETIKELIVHHDILGIPLQLYMLTELFRQNPRKYAELAQHPLNAVDIYHYFIDELFNFYFKKQPSFYANDGYKSMRFDCYKHSALISMRFPRFNDCRPFLKEIQRHGDPVGIITDVTDKDEVPHFLHTSICEYFVAVHFEEHYKSDKQLSVDIANVIFKSEFRNVRFFFDLLLAGNSSLHVAVLYKNMQFLQRNEEHLISCKDSGGRNILHLACSWGQDYPIFPVEVEKDTYIIDDSAVDNFRVVKEDDRYKEIMRLLLEKCKLRETDDLFESTPLEYAKKTNNLFATALILKHQKQLNFDKTMASQMYWSAKFGYLNFLEMFTVIPMIRIKSDHSTLLHRSISHKNFVEKLLLTEKYNKAIDDRDNENQTALLIACQQNSVDVSLILIQNGANNKIPSKTGRLPLHFACQYGNEELVKLLTNPDTINAADNEKLTALHLACFNGHFQIASFLVESGAVYSCDSEKRTPLVSACINGHDDIIDFLIKKISVDLNSSEGINCLHSAASNGHKNSVELLVNKGVRVNSTNDDLRTALHLACARGHIDVVEYLCGLPEIDINKSDKYGWSPLHHAVDNGQGRIVNILIKQAEINKATNTGRTPLFLACRKGYEQIARSLIASGGDKHVKTKLKRTPLHEASQYGNRGIVELLLHEANSGYVDAKDSSGWTALHLACISGNTEVVELLIDRGSHINEPSLNQRTPLHYACQHGHDETVVLLLTHQANVGATDHKQRTPLHLACNRGFIDILRLLRNETKDINFVDHQKWTPLHFACQNGDVNVVKFLLRLGSNVNAKTTDGWTPLHIASLHGFAGIIQLLVSYGSSDEGAHNVFSVKPVLANGPLPEKIKKNHTINCVTNRNWTPLHLACDNNHYEVVRQLTCYEEINCNIANSEGLTPLHIACEKQNLDIIRRLLKTGGNVYATSSIGWTPLHLASARGYTEVCQELLSSEYYIDVDIKDHDNRTPLFIACQNGHDSVVKLLIQAGARLNIRAKSGWSLLHIASDHGFEATVELLLRANMEMNVFDDSDNTPLHLACMNGHLEVVKLLIRAGANVNVINTIGCTPHFLAAEYKHYDIVKFLKKKSKKQYGLNVKRVFRCSCDLEGEA